MEKITKYRAYDGSFFENERECKEYEDKLKEQGEEYIELKKIKFDINEVFLDKNLPIGNFNNIIDVFKKCDFYKVNSKEECDTLLRNLSYFGSIHSYEKHYAIAGDIYKFPETLVHKNDNIWLVKLSTILSCLNDVKEELERLV